MKCQRISMFQFQSSNRNHFRKCFNHQYSHANKDSNSILIDEEVLFRFGLIADIQYVDADDAMNFQGSRMRHYRNSLDVYNTAVKDWNNQITSSVPSSSSSKFKCSIVLGDIIDGKAAALNSQQICYDHFNTIAETHLSDTLYCFGNHCHYSFTRQEIVNKFLYKINDKLNGNSLGGNCQPSKLYYDFSPYPGWRFICVDSYDVSLIGASSIERKELSLKWMAENNPNDVTKSGTWFDNLPYHKRRWVPYNGGVSDEQLQWLDKVLQLSYNQNEKVIIFAHQPIWAPDKPQSLIWNSEDILSVLHKRDNVCLWIAGHDHSGQYDVDNTGIHHLVPPAPIESVIGDKTYGHIDVYKDKLFLTWNGDRPTRTIKPFPYDMMI